MIYSIFSPINRCPAQKRKEILGALMRIADQQFNSAGLPNMTSSLYLSERTSHVQESDV
jgi:hypothetical protein